MKKMKWTVTTLAVSLLIMTFAAAAHATVLRAFVSSTGSDVNIGANCVQATPCKTFNVAIGAVTPGGELIALDTSGYGPITNINKAITIATVPGATAFVVAATATSGFVVNAGATDLVVLRNINFNGSNAAGTAGVQFNSGNLVVQNCTFQQLQIGFNMTPFFFSTKAEIVDSAFTGNITGVAINTGQLMMDNCKVSQNTVGIRATGSGGEVTAATTIVRVSGGSVTDNGTGFEHDNAGSPRPVGSCNSHNIFVRSLQGTITNIAGNTLNVGVNGIDYDTACVPNLTNGSYTSP